MIRFITKRRLAELTGQRDHAKARVSAVQLRLGRIKSERDDLLGTVDDNALLAEKRAAVLENDLRAEAQRATELATDLTQVVAEAAKLRTVEKQLLDVIDYYFTAAEAPVEVLVRDGRVHGVHRSREAAEAAARAADPSIGEGPWRPTPADRDRRVGWIAGTFQLPETENPPHFEELSERYRHTDRGTLFTCDVTNWAVLARHLNEDCRACVAALPDVPAEVLVGAGLSATVEGAAAGYAHGLIHGELRRRLVAADDKPAAVTE
ncbi:hypothetical protein [Streptomyces benahoarensis]|uniref:Uncharacterized protein n=1 Tax=Streptomyces benahoarensis TaxID=2595054 RepID=A0A553ZRA6_9ACTN|nr:hypothetical protein [Streptomyces benahoarensis]TSB32379.1 hypothetical protein FNJ62_01835 [Streptomyces benahoarensis]TSB44008.1 hypothetical protein FNZ23_01555 [Streptomyces benahoarensis]